MFVEIEACIEKQHVALNIFNVHRIYGIKDSILLSCRLEDSCMALIALVAESIGV